MNYLKSFTKLYPCTKTLRFGLEPIGKTKENIERNGIITRDEERSQNYKKMKKTIDEFHKHFIEGCLSNALLNGLEEFYKLYIASTEEKKHDKFKAEFKNASLNLRKEIVKCFTMGSSKETYKDLFKKELIQKRLEDWVKKENRDLYFGSDFKNFTTYFVGYNSNRENMYSVEEKSTSISHRLINENLPRFIDNILIFKQIMKTNVADDLAILYKDLQQDLSVEAIQDMFVLNNFNDTLTQSKINTYNAVVGGKTLQDGTKIKGLNEYINLYNQQQKDKRNKLPKLKMLYKQILGDGTSKSFLPQAFESERELVDAIASFYHNLLSFEDGNNTSKNILQELKSIVATISEYDKSKIYLRNDGQINTVSQRIFGDYIIIKDALSDYYNKIINPDFVKKYESSKNTERLEKEKEKFTKQDYLSIGVIQSALDLYFNDMGVGQGEISNNYSNTCVGDYFKNFFYTTIMPESDKTFDFVSNIEAKYSCIKGLLNIEFNDNEKLSQQNKDNIKLFLDSILELLHFVKPLYVKEDANKDTDFTFYSYFSPLYETLSDITKLYDKVRNFVSRKPYSSEKIKLNFDCPNLANGWDLNMEQANLCIFMLKNNNYYLGVMNANNKPKFTKDSQKTSFYKKMEYKFFKDITTMVPKCSTQLNVVKEHFLNSQDSYILNNDNFLKPLVITKKVFELNNVEEGAKKKFQIDYLRNTGDKEGYKDALYTWMNFCVEFLECYKSTSIYDISKALPVSKYDRLDAFYTEINKYLYQITFMDISDNQVDKLVEENKLYLFRISNKDFSQYSKGTPNLHTLYFKALFDEENLKDVVYKLNGQAEIFFRKASISEDNRIIHKANEPIECKNPELKKKNNTFKYEIIKDKRYTIDKFQFHVPITMNFKATGKENINYEVLQYLKENPDVNIIGIDRGERHLLYISLINQKGEVIKGTDGKYIQYSLNTIKGEYKDKAGDVVPFSTPYHELLDIKEKQRAAARENWGIVENIKELKEGYISQVVNQIAKLMVKHNAIVVMEDLNSGFKNTRVKVEKQVYQKFEKMLIDKLNYLVFKNIPPNEIGGLYNALQLASEFTGFKNLGKQSGFIFYVPAWNTSKIDPVTGFVDLLKPKYNNIADAKAFFSKFKSIRYNKNKDYFEFQFDYKDFTTKAEGSLTEWTVCTFGKERYAFNKSLNSNRGGYEKWNVTEQLKLLFAENKIEFNSGKNVQESIAAVNSAEFFAKLVKNLKITLTMRYSSSDDNRDFILSPVATNGEFFCSEEDNGYMPSDADANGAYHIAKKGLWVLQQINKAEKLEKLNLAITNKEWLSFVQSGKC